MKYFLMSTMIAAAAALGLQQAPPAAAAGTPVLASNVDGGDTTRGFGWRSLSWWHSRSGSGHFCGGHVKQLDEMSAIVEGLFEFTTEQTEAWRRLVAALRDGRSSLEISCRAFGGEAGTRPAPEQLAAVEAAMTSGVEVFRSVRPAFDSFYALLSTQQRQSIDDLFARHSRR